MARPWSSRRLSYAALMVAAGLTGAYAETIPNFEVMTLVVFLAGALLGSGDGALVGAITMLVFTTLNPYGPAHPLVMGAQVAGESLTGFVGGAVALTALHRAPVWMRAVALGVVGAVLTVLFDLFTNLATGLLLGQVRAILVGGIAFSLWHVATNLALFALVGPVLYGVFSHYRSRLS